MDVRRYLQELCLVIVLLCIQRGLCSNIEDDYEDGPSLGRCPYIRNKLKNGRVRYRYKARVAKFLCDSGYELAGKRSSTCVRGQWSNPVPVCIARGCSRVPSIPNGRVAEMYRGALLVYSCDPGYTLEGENSIHCDGRRWSTQPPICVIANENPETSCDFESPDLCGWSHDANHDFDWERHQFTTPSGHVGTGPSFDHTFGENKGGYYLYIEASSPRKINDTARLFSPVYPQDFSGGCFVFWYHMYGATTGGLRVYLKPESHVFDELTPKWEKFGDQGNQWQRGNIIVPVLRENFQIIIEGIRGESYVGDSAIDDVQLSSQLCEDLASITEKTPIIDQNSCKGRCRENDSGSPCSCNDDCFVAATCCNDYLTICGAGNNTTVQNTDEPLPGDFGKTTSPSTASASEVTVKSTEELTSLVTSKVPDTTSPVTVVTASSGSSFVPTSPIAVSSTSTTSTSNSPTTITNIYSSSTTSPSTTTKKSTTAVTTSTVTLKPTITEPSPQTTKTTTYVTPLVSVKIYSTTASSTTSLERSTSSATSIRPTSSTTQTTQSSQSTTVPTTTSITTYIPSSTLSSTSTTVVSSTFPATTLPVESSSVSTSTQSSTVLPSSSVTTLSSTRKTYNLRPRTRITTASVFSTEYKTSSEISTAQLTTASASYTENARSTSEFKSITPFATTRRRFTFSPSFFQIISTTTTELPSSTRASTTQTTRSTMRIPVYVRPSRLPNKFTWSTKSPLPTYSSIEPISKSTKSPLSTTASIKSSTSKAETATSSANLSLVITITVIIILCVVGGLVYYFKKQKVKRQSKLSDDSEMRFLPESEYMEYSDSSALDRILVK